MSTGGFAGLWRIVASVCGVLIVASAIQLISLSTARDAYAANSSGFDAGNIIDDSLFWDGNAMTEAQIQLFLNSKVNECTPGYTCLKDYHESTRTIEATPMCQRYEGRANESAAQIIARVAQTCGVSPKVLLVTLQKEQGLVTKSAPSVWSYQAAMGAGCPDTAACDSDYYGLFNQLHYGAYLLKRYTQPPGTGAGTSWDTRYDLRYPVGKTTAVLYNPNRNCGTLPIYIQNQATHALYIYTPYTPNAAALNAGSGTGDACSSYGNRNFYNYYVAWFGSVRGQQVGAAFLDTYQAHGGSAGTLGFATGPYTCGLVRGGCYQVFRGGWIVASDTTPQIVVTNMNRGLWWSLGNENGYLGYPTSDETCGLVNGGCYQLFEGGWMVKSESTPLVDVPLSTRGVWWYYGNENGFLGYPTSGQNCGLAGGGCFQKFEGGTIVTSSIGGVRALWPEAFSLWANWGRDAGILGYPTGDPSNPAGVNYTQTFQGGTITVTNGTAALTSATDPWFNARINSPWLGNQTTSQLCTLTKGGCYQAFDGGWLVSSPATGAHALRTEVLNFWANWGRDAGILGYPTGDPSNPAGVNYTQTFQGGTITVTNGTAALT